jgi:hypothetical protein
MKIQKDGRIRNLPEGLAKRLIERKGFEAVEELAEKPVVKPKPKRRAPKKKK